MNILNEEIKMSISDIIVTETDDKGIIIFANEDFCKIAGYKKEELLGSPHNMVRHSDMPKAAFKDLWQTVQSGKIWKGIVKNKTKNGGFYWVNAETLNKPSGFPAFGSVITSNCISNTRSQILFDTTSGASMVNRLMLSFNTPIISWLEFLFFL